MFTMQAGSGRSPLPFDLQNHENTSIKKLTALNFQNETLSLGEKLQIVLTRIPNYERVEPTQRRIGRDEVTTIKDCDIQIDGQYQVSIRNQQSFFTRCFTILTDTISFPFSLIAFALGLLSTERDFSNQHFLGLAPKFTFAGLQHTLVTLTKTDAEQTTGEFLRLVLSRMPAFEGDLDIHIEDADHSRLYNVELRRARHLACADQLSCICRALESLYTAALHNWIRH